MTDKELAEEWVKEHWSKNVTELYNTESFQRVKGTPHFYDTNLSEAFLAGLKVSKPQWHDLREDPQDLPKGHKVVLNQVGMATQYDPNRGFLGFGGAGIIAWCEIPTFDKE